MRVVIVEDEKPAARRLIRLLAEVASDAEVVAELSSVEAAVGWFSTNPPPNLVFMDIELEDGLCFEIFEHHALHCPIIFTTAYDEYTLKAFEYNSVHYLLKPISDKDLKVALAKYHQYYGLDNLTQRYQMLTRHMQLPHSKERFLIRIGEHYKSVAVDNINAFYIRERCNFILTDTGRSYPLDDSLDRIEGMVDARTFFRVNRNFIVNISAIADMVAYSSSRLKLSVARWDGSSDIVVSKDRVAAFKKWMDR